MVDRTSSRTVAELELDLSLDDAADEEKIRKLAARKLKCDVDTLPALQVKRRAIDARGGRTRIKLSLAVGAPPYDIAAHAVLPREVSTTPRVVIVGYGPAGLFCAYQLARVGIGSTVIDRGKRVQPRRHDLATLNRGGTVNPDSNYCFGEGGAGTYSDGKLYSRADKRGNLRDVLEVLALHGAPGNILTDARPHIGSNKLPKVITAIRERLENVGVQFRFETRVTQMLLRDNGSTKTMTGVRCADGSEIEADAVVIATGHSARDVYTMLHDVGVQLESKPFALGVRIEHPQSLINHIQYKEAAGHPILPSAAYRLATTIENRGVFSFCMCPGGWIVPAATEEGQVVVNGMSLSKRDSPFANSGLVVGVEPHDLERAGFKGPTGGLAFQQTIEHAAAIAGGGSLRAPAVRVGDFVDGKTSTLLPATSYRPGVSSANMLDVLDAGGVPIAGRLREALKVFGKTMRGYVTDEAVLLGVESRTSSPVRVPRDRTTRQSPDIAGLYPVGEGAGYAGGIVSAAVDGINTAVTLEQTLRASHVLKR